MLGPRSTGFPLPGTVKLLTSSHREAAMDMGVQRLGLQEDTALLTLII